MNRTKLLIWFFWTCVIYIILATAVMYSRQYTLDGVRSLDLKIFAKALKTVDYYDIENNFLELSNILTFNNKKEVLFPLILLTKNECINNGITKHQICNTFKNSTYFSNNINKYSFKTAKYTKVYTINNKNYIYKNINIDYILIGQLGEYFASNSLESLWIFMIDKWVYYMVPGMDEDNKYDGVDKTWEKTRAIFYIVIITSILLFLIQYKQWKNYYSAYQRYKRKEDILNKKLDKLEEKYNKIKDERYNNSEKIDELNLKLVNLSSGLKSKREEYQKEISQLKNKNTQLNIKLDKERDELAKIEREGALIRQQRQSSAKKLDCTMQNEYHEETFKKLDQLVLLWRHDPSWSERKQIESLVSLKNTHLPFTITQAFIAFEGMVIDILKNKNITLGDNLDSNIRRICNYDLIPYKHQYKYQNIRRSRNKWFHSGIYPNTETIDFLIEVVEEYDAKVFI